MTTAGTWYPPSCGTGGFLIELTNPPFTMTDNTEQTTTPELPPEVFAELLAEALRATKNNPAAATTMELARLAYAAGAKAGAKDEYQRGADAELKAVLLWLQSDPYTCHLTCRLRAARRPKPQSLKEQALEAFEELIHGAINVNLDPIRRALKSLPDPQ